MQWKLLSEGKPEQYSRVLIHRLIGKHSYVDVVNYFEEPPENKMPTLNNLKGITHWMPLPDPPKDL